MSVTRTRKAFWKPGEAGPGAGILTERNESYIPPNNPNAGLSLSQQRARLPVFKYRESILYMLEKFQTLVVVGETGSGKSTQIPQYLHEAGWTADGRVVACLQPRRIAAVSVAERVAAERGVALGGEVGYSIRFDERTDAQQTRIKYMTEGMLLRAMMRDPLLARYSVIMLDEAHERTVFLDVIVGLLLKIQRKRKDLRVIVSSATVNAELFRAYFNTNRSGDPAQDSAAILTVEGRTHPVEVLYAAEPVANYVQTTVDTVLAIHESESEGDILAFLTGQDEVDTVVDQLRDRSQKLSGRGREVVVLPMYGGLPQADQMAVFETVPGGMRKVIVATNIAEASVTIPGIVFVVDCGFVKIKGYNSQTGIESLVIAPISKASANQRSGRAGRVQSGKVFRLYQESGFSDILPDATVPEMQRCEVSGVLLQLKALGIDNVLRFPFISPPSAQAVANALQSLFALGGLDEDCKLTEPLGMSVEQQCSGREHSSPNLNGEAHRLWHNLAHR